MNDISYKNVHNKFKLNGFHLDRDNLCRVAYSFIKEGEEFEKPVGDFILDWFDNNDYIEMSTSGSTGIPKIIRAKKEAMVKSAIATGNFFDLKPGDRVLHCLPIKYVAGKMMFIRAFILGLDMDFVAPSSTPLKNTDGNYDFSAMVPMQAKFSLKELPRIKKIIIGGAKINAPLEKELKKLKTQTFETFGMTETVSHIAAKKLGDKLFNTLTNIKVSADERGCLVVEATDITDQKIITNDLINCVSDTQFEFLGRLDNIINSGGIKIVPEAIEFKLATSIEQRFFIAGKPDADLGEKVILVIEGAHFDVDATIFNILDKYEKPKEIIFIDKFKETGNGKVIRKESLMQK